jgi:hypothetical protein
MLVKVGHISNLGCASALAAALVADEHLHLHVQHRFAFSEATSLAVNGG